VNELRVVGVRVELPVNQPIVLLKEADGDRYLPIWIGAVEASAIAFEQQGVRPARPLTHDLLRDVIGALGGPAGGRAHHRPARRRLLRGAGVRRRRPGQRQAVRRDRARAAVRDDDPGEEAVLAEAGISIPDEQEDEVEKFREFLDTISPDDFAGSEPRGVSIAGRAPGERIEPGGEPWPGPTGEGSQGAPGAVDTPGSCVDLGVGALSVRITTVQLPGRCTEEGVS
jgi:hypothetical protein